MHSKKSPAPKVKPLEEGAVKIVMVRHFQNAMHKKIQNSKTSELHMCYFGSLKWLPKAKVIYRYTDVSFDFIKNDTGVVSKRTKKCIDLVKYVQNQIFIWLWNSF